MDFLNNGIPLGRYFKVEVVLQWTFFLTGFWLVSSMGMELGLIYTAMLLILVLLHEFGHAVAARLVGGRADLIVIGPFGGYNAAAVPLNTAWKNFVWVLGGPAVNAILLLVFWFLENRVIPHILVGPQTAFSTYLILAILVGSNLNQILLVFNILPIYPMDGGQLLQSVLWGTIGHARSMEITGMIGTVGGASLMVIGLNVIPLTFPAWLPFEPRTNFLLVFFGLQSILASFALYQRGRHISSTRRR